MSADQLLYQMDPSSHQNEWYDFDNFIEFPSGDIDSNSTSVDSISPKDYALNYSDVDGSNWNSDFGVDSQAPFSSLAGYENPLEECALGTEPFADLSEILQFPASSESEGLVGSTRDDTWSSSFPSHSEHFYSTIRQMVESQAAVDVRCSSSKEKRMEASIALHMQRLHDVSLPELDLFSDSNTTFASPCWSETARANVSHSGSPATTLLSEPTSKSPTPPAAPDGIAGGMELVLDMNMNTPANLPRKQKPRSRAQKENYIKVRKHGACEKHRKQHKRCNCLEATASRVNVKGPVLSTANEVLRPFGRTQLHVHGPEQNRILLQTKLRQTSPQQTVQPAAVGDRNHGDRPTLDTHISRHSPCSPQYAVCTSNLGGRKLHVHSPIKEAAPWHGVDQVPSSHGQLGALPVRDSLKQPVTAPTNLLRLVSNRKPLVQTTTVIGSRNESQTPEQSIQRMRERWPIRAGQETVQLQTIPFTPNTNASGSESLVVQQRSLFRSAVTVLYSTVLAFSQFWQSSASVTSWAGNLVERFLVFSSRQYWHVRKGVSLV